jgi:hypothetical protein
MAQHSVEPLASALTPFVRVLADQSEDQMVSGRLFLVLRYFGFGDAIYSGASLRYFNPWALTFAHKGEVMTSKYEAAEALKKLDEAKAKEFDWESNRDDENPEQLPWPEENESKE